MFLTNGTARDIFWRAFDPADRVYIIGTQDGILTPVGTVGHMVEYNHPSGHFQLEIQEVGVSSYLQRPGRILDNSEELAVMPVRAVVSIKDQKPAFIRPGVSMLVEGNGQLGVLSLSLVNGTLFYGSIYGDALQGYWAPTNALQFRRNLNAPEFQVWDSDELTDSAGGGTFRETLGGRPKDETFAWRMARDLAVIGNGYVGTVHFDTMLRDGGFTGSIYGDSISGRWNQATAEITFLRTTSNPAYSQQWVGRRTGVLTFEGTFDERHQGHPSGSFAWKMGPQVPLP